MAHALLRAASRLISTPLEQSATLFAALLLACPSLLAWNGTGHRVIAAIAYDRLTDSTRARVDALLTQHPDYALLRAKLAPATDANPKARAREVFIAASTWADQIRTDNRFYDETKAGPAPRPIPGFPDMGRHLAWHYIRVPFSTDGTPTKQPSMPNIVTEVARMIGELVGPETAPQSASYDLVWLLHLIGDLHQPLHAVSRYSASQPGGDRGGNLVWIAPNRSLHSLWDQALGLNSSPENVARLARQLAPKAQESPETSPALWIEESFALNEAEVYTFGNRTGSKEAPLVLQPTYRAHMVMVSKEQITKAGMRLAATLNEILQ